MQETRKTFGKLGRVKIVYFSFRNNDIIFKIPINFLKSFIKAKVYQIKLLITNFQFGETNALLEESAFIAINILI